VIRDRLRRLGAQVRERLRDGVAQGRDRLNRPESWAPEPTRGLGRAELESGVVLERSALGDAAEVAAGTSRPGRLVLVHHWATWAPAVEQDVPLLLELHLSWAQYVDFIGVSWELMVKNQSTDEAALAVDDFHRAYGLTWRSLIATGRRGQLIEALRLRSELLPQTWLYDRDGQVVWLQEGALDEAAYHQIEGVISEITGVRDRARPAF
jgi:hypothetical protein